jgi:hypothetical protein
MRPNRFHHQFGLKDAKVKPVPAKVSLQLHAFKDEPPFNLNFNHTSEIDSKVIFMGHEIVKL